MSVEVAARDVTTRVEWELRNEFPGWWIRRCESGSWRAIQGNDHVAARSADDLRRRLRSRQEHEA